MPKIPGFLMEAPKVSNGQFKWNCAGCSFHIDLLNLSQDNMKILPADTLNFLNNKSWIINDTRIQEALFQLVSHHYQTQHLGPNSIHVVQSEGGKWQVTDHRPNRRAQPKNVVEIKQESISEESSLQLRRSSRMPRRPRRHDEDW